MNYIIHFKKAFTTQNQGQKAKQGSFTNIGNIQGVIYETNNKNYVGCNVILNNHCKRRFYVPHIDFEK